MRNLHHLLRKGARLPPGIERVETRAPENDLNPTVRCPCCNTRRSADMIRRDGERWACGNCLRHERRCETREE